MGLINTSHKEVIQSINNFQADILKHPYYLFNDKKANIVTYYNLNTTRTTLDVAAKIPYSNLGEESPLRFNRIKDMFLYGLERVSLSLEQGDFGLESSSITGDGVVLPDTIQPYPGDYFTINVVQQKYVFKVIDATPDTFQDGANYWRISYQLDQLNIDRLEPLVVAEFQFVSGNVGTNFNCILPKTKWDLSKELDDRAVLLKQFYKSLYYNEKVQTYTYTWLYKICQHNYHSAYFYDPYLIQFIMNNGILKNDGSKYIYIGHKTVLEPTFAIKYSKSIWACLEAREKDNIHACTIQTYAKYIDDPSTIFQTRYEDYYELTYDKPSAITEYTSQTITILDPQVIGHIEENDYFSYDDLKYSRYNLLVKYMNDQDISIEDLVVYDRIQDFENDPINYFLIPMAIFCMEYYIKKLMTKTS